MIRVLLDTHAFLWALGTPDRLSPSVRNLLVDPSTVLVVSAVTALEVATKVRTGKLDAAQVVAHYGDYLRALRAEELAVSSRHSLTAGSLPCPHRDPFDRLLAAQAIHEGLALVTCDPVFSQFPVQVLW